MIPILYEPTETAFTSNGICRLRDCLSCVVVEGRNSVYECDFEYPVDGSHFSDIKVGRIIAVEHDESDDVQPFDIVSYSKPLNGIVSFHAVHISYRLNGIIYGGNVAVNSLAFAISRLTSAFVLPPHNFHFETDKTSEGYASAFDGTPRTLRQLLGGVEGSILDAYGGEYEWDKFTVHLWNARGSLKDFTIKYGVNLLDYNDETDASNVYTAVYPYWKGQDENGLEIIINGGWVDAYDEYITRFADRRICIPLDLSDKFETRPTGAQMVQKARSMMQANQSWIPAQSLTVNFLNLRDTDEYKQFEPLYKCKLCDSIRVFFPKYGVNQIFKIVKTTYDVLDERYQELELGSIRTSLADVIGGNSSESSGPTNLPYVLLAGSTMTGDLIMSNGADIDLNGESLLNRVHVVETGTSGIWKYRKWSDGTAECWGRTSSSSFTWSTYTTGLYYNSNNWLISLPFAFKDTNYVVTANTYYVGGAVGWVANANAYDSSTFKLTIVRNGNTGDVYVNIHVIGRWK